MKKQQITNGLLGWVAPLLVLGCAGWFVYLLGASEKPERKKPPVRKSIPVEVIQSKPHTGTLDIVTSGVAIPYREVQLAARVGGEVVYKPDSLSPGRTVQKGEVLLRIDPADYEIEVARLQQEVAKVEVDLDRLVIDKENTQRLLAIHRDLLNLQKKDVDRFSQLRRSNATSASETEAVKSVLLTMMQQTTSLENQLRTFDSQVQTLEMTRKLAALQLKRAELDLARTEIKAPFSGVVIANQVEQNGMIASGMVVATIEDTSKVEVRTNLRRDDLAFLQGQGYDLPQVPVTIEYERGGKTTSWNAVLSRQDGLGIDEKTRTMPVRIRVDNPTQNLKSGFSSNADSEAKPTALLRGMFVRVLLHCQPEQPLIVVPESVIRPGKTLWLMRDQSLHIEPIRIARIEANEAYIDVGGSSLSTRDSIISSPVPNARQGLAVSMLDRGPRKKRTTATASDASLTIQVAKRPMSESEFENPVTHQALRP